ncbi:MAG: UDP-glucose 4-epimerase [Gammaproteobacteria bacterium]|jgi:UDP-glucose 4-epimerase
MAVQMESSKPTVMVTGAAGSLARMVIQKLKPTCNVVAIYFRDAKHVDTSITHYRVDMNKRGFEDVFRDHKIDAVIHLGRINAHMSSIHARYATNVLGTRRLLDLCLKYAVGNVQILSTYFVYGANSTNPALLDEEAPLRASSQDKNLIDMAELEHMANIYMWKHPELNLTILRPCNIIGPGTRNALSLLLSRTTAPALLGFSPMMQFLHLEDMASAIIAVYKKNKPGIYNVAPDDYIAYQDALRACGCKILRIPSIPPQIPLLLGRITPKIGLKTFPRYLVNYVKYPVIIDGIRFITEFDWQPEHDMSEMFSYYAEQKSLSAGSII